jgi:large subunit ribosomal protein L10
MPTEAKKKEVAVLKDKISRANNIIVTDHTGINVGELTGLRRDLKNSNAEFRIAKNTLIKIAVKESGLDNLVEYFVGPTSLIFGYDDPSLPARIIHKFQKDTEKPKVKAYILDSQLLSLEDFKTIAKLPSREELLANLVGSINWPIVEFVMTIEGVIKNLIGLFDALVEKEK